MTAATRDAGLTIVLVAMFATLAAAHAATVFGLARKRRPVEALVALLVPPLAPCWAITRGMRARALVWLASAALYVAALVLARW
jgi:hypothetical protein